MKLERWEIDGSHSGIHFAVRHLVVAKVRGRFARWSGTILMADGDIGPGSVEVVIDAASIDTGVAERDAHLRSPDFLDAASHPEITFKSKEVKRIDGDQLAVMGELTIRGVTREVVLAAEHAGRAKDPWGNERVGFSAKLSLDRKEFGLAWNQVLETGGLLVGERVDIDLEVEAVKQAGAKTA